MAAFIFLYWTGLCPTNRESNVPLGVLKAMVHLDAVAPTPSI